MYGASVSEVYIAVAFFTDEKMVKDMISENGCLVRMVVRLGFPTKPSALRALINKPGIEVRYYSDSSFHPKLYIFGDKVALLGSANLTKSAILTNQEIMISIESKDPRFGELAALFSDYWDNSKVLTSETLDAYEKVYEKYGKAIDDIFHIDGEIQSKIGKTTFPNIVRGEPTESKENIFLDTYRKTYQETVTAFRQIKEVYESTGKRKNDFNSIPIRLEIDSFLSFVRGKHATLESWQEPPIGWSNERKTLLQSHIREWLQTDYPHYDTKICRENYPFIIRTLGSVKSIEGSKDEEIIDALVVLHSFHDSSRFKRGGLNALRDRFKKNNDPRRVKSSLIYLLYGKGDIVKRMADLIYNGAYKLNEFGEASVHELVGWINSEELPVINGRTTKVLRYYGFDVRQL